MTADGADEVTSALPLICLSAAALNTIDNVHIVFEALAETGNQQSFMRSFFDTSKSLKQDNKREGKLIMNV